MGIIVRPDSDGIKTICKVRGILLNYKNKLDIHFETVFDLVSTESDKKMTVADQKNSRIVTKTESKDYKIVFDKRIITSDYIINPYGY